MAEPKPATTTTPARAHTRPTRAAKTEVTPVVARCLRTRPDLLRSTALQAVFLAAIAVPATGAAAQTMPAATTLPTGGTVIAGQAQIVTTTPPGGAAMTITQGTKYGAYDWKSFDIGKNAAVTYQVPTSQSISVNRVISSTSPSVIAGKLSSNGVLVVQNQSGVVFTQGAEVNVSTLIATAPGMSDANARAGRLIFDQPANPGARVENHGTITVAQTGLAALVAPQVANSGVIRAQMGRVVLAGAEAHTVDLYGDGLLSIDVTRQVTQAPAGPDGKTVTALVTNSGTILADGGTILLTASAVDGLVQNLVTAGGVLQADTSSATAGRVAVTARGGNVTVSGTIAARGTTAGSKGGAIEINAPSRSVTLKPSAVVDASGRAGGGRVAIGTTIIRAKAGPGTTAPTARDVLIEFGARVAANATGAGKGGDITVLSQGGVTRHLGELSSRGGPDGGDGGFIEVSGDSFVLRGGVDTSASAGRAGSILLDPIDLVITTSKTTNAPTNDGKSIVTTDLAGITNLAVKDIQGLKGDITIQAKGTFTVSAEVDVTKSADSVTLLSVGLMKVDAPIIGAKNITLTTTAGDIAIGKSGSITSTGAGQTIALNTPAGISLAGSIISGADAKAGGIIDLNAGAGVVQSAGSLIASTLLSSTDITGTVTLGRTTNQIASLGKFAITAGDLALATSRALDVTGAVKVDSGRFVSLAVDGFTASATIDTGTGSFELAPATKGTMSLGKSATTELTLVQASLDNITAGTLKLGSASAGTVTATSIALNTDLDSSKATTTLLVAGSGGIALAEGTLKASTLDLTTAGGGVTDTTKATIAAATLQSTGGVVGNVVLNSSTHAVGGLGAMTVTGGTIALTTSLAVPVTGAVLADGIALSSTAAASAKAIEVTATGALTASKGGTIALVTAATSGITLSGTVNATATGKLDLTSGALGIAQDGASLTTGTLLSSGGVAGTVKLAQPSNAVGGVGTFAVSGADFSLATGSAVTITGALSANNVTITNSAIGAKAIAIAGSGSVAANGAGGIVTLAATKGGIALSGAATAKGAIDLSAAAGGVVQTTGSLTTPSLISTGGITGTATLTSPTNAIDATGGISITGGNLLLASASTLDIAGALAVDKGQSISLALNGFKANGTLSATGGTVEIAPLAGGAMTLGKALATELAVSNADLSKISTDTLRLGTSAATKATADSIVARDTFDARTAAIPVLRLDAAGKGIAIDTLVALTANTLDLNATGGGVTGGAGALVTATRLQSSSGIAGTMGLAISEHAVDTLGAIAVKGGTLSLRTNKALDIVGPVSADAITLNSSAASGSAISGSGTLSTPAGGTITLAASNAAGGIVLTGTVDATDTGVIDLSARAGGIKQSAGSLTAATLGSTGGSTAAVSLTQGSNAVGAVADFAVSGGDFTLTSKIATTVTGTLSASNIALTNSDKSASALSTTGTVKAATNVALTASNPTGGIALSGTVDAGGALDLAAGTGGVLQSKGSILAATLLSSSGVAGTVSLESATNKIGTLGTFALTKVGSFSLAGAGGLKVTGTLSTTDGGITLVETAAATLDIAAPLSAGGAGHTILLRASDAAGAVALGADVTAGSKGTIDLSSGSGGIKQSAGSLTAETLRSSFNSTGTVALTSLTNQVGTLSGFNVTAGDLTLVNATSLALAGAIAAGTLDLSTLAGTGISSTGVITATQLRSSSGVVGTLDAPGNNAIAQVGDIKATGGDIILGNQTGTTLAIAGTLEVDPGRTIRIEADSTTVTTGALAATGGTIVLLAPTAAISLGAANGGDLAVKQSDIDGFTADRLNLISETGSITLRANLDTSSKISTSLALNAATGLVLTAGTLTATTLELVTTAGGATQTAGLLAAKVLVSGAGGITGSVALDTTANAIATIGDLTATGSVAVSNAIPLDVAGTIKASAIALAGSAAGTSLSIATTGTLSLTSPGTIALASNNAAGSTLIAGTINTQDKGTLLLAGAGSVNQSAGSITAGTLTAPTAIGAAELLQAGNAIATLGAFISTGSLALQTNQALTVTGAVSAPAISLTGSAAVKAAIDMTGSLTAAGGTIALSATDTKGGLSLAGTLDGDQVNLVAGSGGIAEPGGSIGAGTLRVSVIDGNATLGQAGNTITLLGDSTVTGGSLTLVDSLALSVIGTINADAITLTSTGIGALSAGGTLATAAGGTITLIASNPTGAIDLVGIIDASATGILDLSAGAGVSQSSGAITAGTLRSTDDIGGSMVLSQANAISRVGALTTGGGAIVVSVIPIDIAGPFSGVGVEVIGSATGTAITVSGSIAASFVATLTANDPSGGVALAGTVTAPTLLLNAGSGGVAQSAGSIIVDTLLSSNGVKGDVSLNQAGNVIGALGTFDATGKSFTLQDSIALTVAGSLTASAVTLASSAATTKALDVTGTVTANTLTLTAKAPAGGIALSGTLTAAGSATLAAGSGGIAQSAGSLTANVLAASATGGSVDLAQPANAIVDLAPSNVTGGDFTLVSANGFSANGVVADNVSLRALSGDIATKSTGIATNAAGQILLDAAGGIVLAGPLNAGAGIIDLTAGSTGITQSASGVITAGTLQSTSGVVGNVALATAANAIVTLGDIAVTSGKLAVASTTALTVAGTVKADSITLSNSSAAAAAFDVTGTLRSAAGGAIIIAATGGIALSGVVDASASGVVDLHAGGPGITQTAGSITAATLQSANGIAGTTTLDQPGNTIANLGKTLVTSGDFSLTVSNALAVIGPVDVKAGSLTLTSTAAGMALSVAGVMDVSGAVNLAATAPDGGIVLASAIQAATLNLVAGTGGVNQTAGAVNVAMLKNSGLNGSVNLSALGNNIGTIGAFTVTNGDISLHSTKALTIAGTLAASQGNVSVVDSAIDNKAIDITGKMDSGPGKAMSLSTPSGGISVAPGGSIAAPSGPLDIATATGIDGPGTIAAGTLSVGANMPGDIILTGANIIGTLSGASLASGILTLNNAALLTISGPITAREMRITANDLLKVSNGVVIATDGKSRAAQSMATKLNDLDIFNITTAQLGSFLEVKATGGGNALIDIGNISTVPISVATSTLNLVLPKQPPGTITMGQLIGKSTDLILITHSGGVATGTVDVAGLLVLGGGGKADLFGRVGGLDGQAAANKANISPLPTANYRFNACPITSINCVLLPVQTIPPISPLRDVPIIRDRPSQDDADVQLPNVSDEDY